MRNALALAGVALAITTACSHTDTKMQPDPGRGYTLETTGAVIGRDDPQRNEPDPTVGEVAIRLAGQICEREARCHGSAAPAEQCMRAYGSLTALEVATWGCSAAATRSRAKECIAALNAEPCEMDMSTKPELCPPSDACPETTANLISPGAALAQTGPAMRDLRASGFDSAAAAKALASIDLSTCRDPLGSKGRGHVLVTFAPDGSVANAEVDQGASGAPLTAGSPLADCVLAKVRAVRIPAFTGAPVKVGKSIRFD